MNKFVVGGRFWGKEGELERLIMYADAASACGAEKVFITIRSDEDQSGALDYDGWPEKVELVPVTPWGKFVPSLNSLLRVSRKYLADGCNMLFASTEVILNKEITSVLCDHMDSSTLVSGAVLVIDGEVVHDFDPVKFEKPKPANGMQIPWNATNMWNTDLLWRIGFLNIGEGVLDDEASSGVEEFCTAAVIQDRYGAENALMKLVYVPGIEYQTYWYDSQRQKWNDRKFASKISRPQSQLEVLGFDRPKVIHLDPFNLQ